MIQNNEKFNNLDDAIDNLIKKANEDYCDRSYKSEDAVPEHVLKMQDEFTNGWTVEKGRAQDLVNKNLPE